MNPWRIVENLAPALANWLPQRRWFGGKGRTIVRVAPVRVATVLDRLEGGGPLGLVTIVEVCFADGAPPQLYQVPLGFRRGGTEFPVIATIGELAGYDATADAEITGELLRLMTRNEQRDTVYFGLEPGGGHAFAPRRGMPVRPLGAEQSNSSLVFGERFVLKLFRRLALGTNPDLELHRALNHARSQHIAPLLGAIETVLDATPVTLGMLYSFAADAQDGWQLATTQLRDLLRGRQTRHDLGTEARLLGEAVAAVHAHLAVTLGHDRMTSMDVAQLRDGMLDRFTEAEADVPALARHADGAKAVFAAVDSAGEPVHRVHGDLHLGQVLRTPNRWLLIDFEGEPAAPLDERLAPQSPMRDVAGMLRSFDYAATMELRSCRHPDPEGSQVIADRWLARARGSFLRGYAKSSGADLAGCANLLAAYELDKAVYEVCYETRNRPDWVEVPLQAVRRLTTPAPHEVHASATDLLE